MSQRLAPGLRKDDSELDRLPGVHVLLVDDNSDARTIFTSVLEYCGALVTVVSSARAALKALEHVKPHIIVSDLNIPDRDGYWLIRSLRRLEGPTSRIPAVAVTGYPEDYEENGALSAGFQEYLQKPVDVRRLCKVVRRLVPLS